jgi:hypothetical protein
MSSNDLKVPTISPPRGGPPPGQARHHLDARPGPRTAAAQPLGGRRTLGSRQLLGGTYWWRRPALRLARPSRRVCSRTPPRRQPGPRPDPAADGGGLPHHPAPHPPNVAARPRTGPLPCARRCCFWATASSVSVWGFSLPGPSAGTLRPAPGGDNLWHPRPPRAGRSAHLGRLQPAGLRHPPADLPAADTPRRHCYFARATEGTTCW